MAKPRRTLGIALRATRSRTRAATIADQVFDITAPDVSGLEHLAASPREEEAVAINYLDGSGIAMASVVLGLLDQSDDCIKVIGKDGSLQFMNCRGKVAMQVDDFGAIAGRPWNSLWPDDARPLIDAAVSHGMDGRLSRFEAFCPTAKGEPRWWEVTVSPVRSGDGSVAALISTSRDISDRKRREEVAATVALEMRHRLRNAHSVSAALLLASGKASPDHKDFAHDVAVRLGRLSEVQARLVDVGGGMTLATLCDDVRQMFEQCGGQITIGPVPDLRFGDDLARAVSLLLGELTTNSLKHGALGRGGAVSLDLALQDETLTFDWSERFTGGDPSVSPSSSGQGTDLMRRIAGLYRGTIECGATADGFRADIRLPVEAL